METLEKLSELTEQEIGTTEEDVKINFIVPFLEAFGHKRLNFEHKYKDIIIKQEGTNDSQIIVETKRYNKPLDNELNQLERYCKEENPLLAIITNGDEIRFYSPDWKRIKTFSEKAIYIVNRKEISNPDLIPRLKLILDKRNFINDTVADNIDDREKEIRDFFKNVNDKIQEINNIILKKENEIKELKLQREALKEDYSSSEKYIPNIIRKPTKTFEENGKQENKLINKKRRGNLDFLNDYILPVISGIKNGNKRTEVVKTIAQKLNVEISTVNDRCTRKLKIKTSEFDELVSSNRIYNFLINKFPERKSDIEKIQ